SHRRGCTCAAARMGTRRRDRTHGNARRPLRAAARTSASMDSGGRAASLGPWARLVGRAPCGAWVGESRSVPGFADRGEDAIGLDAPVGASGVALAEQATIGEVGDPGLATGGAVGRPGGEAGFAHRLSDLADLLGAASAV